MFNFTKLNKGTKFNFDTTNLPYADIKNVFALENGKDCIYRVRAIYINRKSKFGEAPVIALDSCLINLPQHTMDQVETILNDEDAIASVNNGECGIKIYQYNSTKYNRVCYSVEWVNIKADQVTTIPVFNKPVDTNNLANDAINNMNNGASIF